MNIINYDELFVTRKQLIEEISSLSHEEFNQRPGTDVWSIAQVAHHLYLVEDIFVKAIAYGLNKVEDSKTDQINIEGILDRTKKLNAPEMVIPSAESFDVEQIINLLNQSRNKLLTLLDTIKDPSLLVEKSGTHPAFGKMPLNQWIDFIYLHEQRHIQQMNEIKQMD